MTDPVQMPNAPVMPPAQEVGSTDGVTIAAYESTPADPSSPEVLLCHANGFCAGVFAPLADALGPHRWVGYDARAHGNSTRGAADMAWEGHRDDALSVIDAFELRRPVGVGHSMGGAALLLAEVLRPGTFAALWLFEPIVFPPGLADSADNPMETAALRRRTDFASREEAFANFASKAPLWELSPECLSAYVTYGFHDTPEGVTLACRPEDEAAGYRMGGRHRAWDHLGDIRCPVVVVRGRDDHPGPASVAPMLADALPAGRLDDHPELGHFGPLAEPEMMAESLRELINGIAVPGHD